MFGKKIKKKILYAAYQSQQEMDVKEKEVGEAPEKKEESTSSQRLIEERYTSRALVIAVCNLEGKSGCTHLTGAIRKYYSDQGFTSCVMTSHSDLSKPTRDQVIILDFGKEWEHNQEMLTRADWKIMICLYQESQVELAKFVRGHPDWIYAFNLVPKNRRRAIEDLMEDYKYYLLPLFDVQELEESMLKILRQMLPRLEKKKGGVAWKM